MIPKQIVEQINNRLKQLVDDMCEPGILKDAISYSLLGGGKRIRPALCLMSAEVCGEAREALDFACAIEMIHTYSLIHDDLPAMDNDVLRRGKPTNHVVFGEGYAILAGDALLNCAFEVMLDAANNSDCSGKHIKAMHVIAKAAGVKGMIAGQAADLLYEGKEPDFEALNYIHLNKTAALIRASVTSGAVLAGANQNELEAFDVYGKSIGLTFQIVDDMLDVYGNERELGKSTGKDDLKGKLTYVRALGFKASRDIAQQKTKQAKEAVSCFGKRADALISIANGLLNRQK